MNQVATLPKKTLVDGMAARYDMEPKAFVEAIKASVIKGACSNEQFAAFLMVAKEYDLNPLTKEIYAFPDRGGITPIVSIDGWMKLINSHPQFDGMEFDDTIDAGKLSSVTCRMYRKDRSPPNQRDRIHVGMLPGHRALEKWPARMLRHKAAIQAARYAFGFSGIMEPDEYDRMKDVTPAPVQTVANPFGEEPQGATVEEAEVVASETETLASGPDNSEQDTSADLTSTGSVEGGEPMVDQAPTDNSGEVADDVVADTWVLNSVNMLIASAMIGGELDIMRNQYRSIKQNSPEWVDAPTMGRVTPVSIYLSQIMRQEDEFDKQRIAAMAKVDVEQINDLPEAE